MDLVHQPEAAVTQVSSGVRWIHRRWLPVTLNGRSTSIRSGQELLPLFLSFPIFRSFLDT